ncbi:hypothetical protein [Bacteroides fragilis]|nr:hypothetical protein [Bacteroides fragilis]MCE8600455.1 hypothetical protein [Bacteroides fragilis]MCE8634026.1 hypothetical protein [Bacteroides fragilis]MCE8677701.1 hypothetical protein [Bacteroides fragilis]MCE8682440.1 hypothetical protein [Bacteroides fragilis]MCM0296311.1 hypothetical protein [Bacteroides fragilis]
MSSRFQETTDELSMACNGSYNHKQNALKEQSYEQLHIHCTLLVAL